MKLLQALKIGQHCGLETVGECILNIQIHAGSLFSYSDINKELNELIKEFDAIKVFIDDADSRKTDEIMKVLLGMEDKEIYAETDKFNHMISAFQCDFSLAKEGGKYSLAALDSKIRKEDKTLMKDIELLEELEWNLRNGYMKIVKVND